MSKALMEVQQQLLRAAYLQAHILLLRQLEACPLQIASGFTTEVCPGLLINTTVEAQHLCLVHLGQPLPQVAEQ